jgi:hypothetical protein
MHVHAVVQLAPDRHCDIEPAPAEHAANVCGGIEQVLQLLPIAGIEGLDIGCRLLPTSAL